MPELPEVETTRRGIESSVVGQVIKKVIVREPRLRWRVPRELPELAAGQRVVSLRRRAKYLVFDLQRGGMILHLGMSGSLRVLPGETPPSMHDHVDIVMDTGLCLRFNDPRRFGSLLWVADDPLQHKLLKSLAPEPLSDEFNGEYLARAAKGRSVAIKQLIMNGQVVVGVGNIYASEALFRAGVRPRRAAGRLKRAEFEALVKAIKEVLNDAIRAGGTTLRDYFNPEGMPGYFRQKLFVYERTRDPCRVCKTPIKHFVQGQRSTYFCPQCQK
ncbi:bifunctional DNA-formamidopyrimidine glycosylase/DNA-(apurinic or apyrimidinic site) lyase [Steroidobacter sp. S1-65]|uniref:Formamidopyrimidine-DNA glycosylase n=1 Tax=Steroidobacter gossypii TaxID=2805490 RepID=A0ABS1WS60_9GAMM|nr:bifunctional DNA-formamidopyrimidine glycosylase/DNA-(apurinic or apyrimidinic site) lyase [Steroidobacter gossypii]MBM0103804.1 bifunctional DNA-formamidopyrimidine glycosylase/DNA-(apurinic or apyrimidinic site) lyase [Steroidobacter gossypii]